MDTHTKSSPSTLRLVWVRALPVLNPDEEDPATGLTGTTERFALGVALNSIRLPTDSGKVRHGIPSIDQVEEFVGNGI